jgi:glycosyltransferase involved in cell wall biosynthesis
MLRIDTLTRDDNRPCSIDAVYRDLDSHVARELTAAQSVDGVYAYENAALRTFETAKRLGVKTAYEVASGYWHAAEAIFAEEAELNPDWARTIRLRDSRAKKQRKDAEIALADRVIVASSFTAKNLRLGPSRDKNIAVIPFGAPSPPVTNGPARSDSPRLRVLFVGGLSQGKGLSYLFAAAESVERAISLTVIGRRNCDCAPLDEQLSKRRYIPTLPHDEVLQEMRRHDVLVFPSLCDGFGLVILEAMSQGLPVVASTNSGGPDVIEDGTDGFIVPIRSADAIAAKLELLAGDRDRLSQMKHAALATARRYTWDRYQKSLIEYVL